MICHNGVNGCGRTTAHEIGECAPREDDATEVRDEIAREIEQLQPASYTQAMWRNGWAAAVVAAAEVARGGGQDA